MGIARNAGLTLLVTAILVGALLLLFPTPAGAVRADMAAGDVSQIGADGSLRIAFDLRISAGEHFPVDEIEVRAIQDGFSLGPQGRIAPEGGAWRCGGPVNTNDHPAKIVLISITGGTATVDDFSGQGYTNVGYSTADGYHLNGHQSLGGLGSYDNGYGYGKGLGYGYGSSNVDLRITVELRDCGFFAGTTPFSSEFTFQAIVGAAGLGYTAAVPTVPVTKTLVNPAFTQTQGTSLGADVSTSTSGPVTTALALLNGGGQGEFIQAGSFSSGYQPLPGMDLPGVSDVLIRTQGNPSLPGVTPGTIPAGTEISIAHHGGGGTSAASPAFGISGVALSTSTSQTPLTYFRVLVSVPGIGPVDPAAVLAGLEFTTCYDAADVADPDLVQMRGFAGDGSAKSSHPTLRLLDVKGQLTPDDATDDEYCFTFRITDFSSFAVIMASTGGGATGTTTTTSPPLVDEDEDGLPDSWELQHFGNKTGADPTGDADDDGLSNLAEYVAETDPTKADTDGDGISDRDEIAQGTDPLDDDDPGMPGTTGTGPVDTGSLGPREDNSIPGMGLMALLAGLCAVVLVRRRL